MLRNALATAARHSSAGLIARSALRPAATAAFNSAPSTSTLGAVRGKAYSADVIDHYENPRNVGSFLKSDKNVGIGLVGAPACGDVMKLSIKVNDQGIIEDVRFKTFGCGSAIASSSYMTERIKGMTLDEAGAIKNTEIAKELSLPPVKLHCSMLAEDSVRAAIRDYKSKVEGAGAKAGSIDVSQSIVTGKTTHEARPNSTA